MSVVKQIYRLHQQGKKIKQIACICQVSKNTVKKYLHLAQSSDKELEDLLEMEEEHLEEFLLPTQEKWPDDRYEMLLSQMDYFHKELKRTGVNRWVLWSEYRRAHPAGYSYSQFCYHLQQFDKLSHLSMVQIHEPGDLLYIDFAGKTMSWIDPKTKTERKAQLFGTALGYSQYSYVEGVESQSTEDLIGAFSRGLQYIGGVPRGIVPDNMKTAVIKTDRYEPTLNRILEDFANHYRTAIIPTRSARPRDKALVENLIKHTYSHIYAPLRNRVFHSLDEINEAIQIQLDQYNHKKFKGRDYSRADLFFTQEKSLLSPLPETPFEIKKYRELTVHKNCHIRLGEDKHYYSVPYAYVGRKVKAG